MYGTKNNVDQVRIHDDDSDEDQDPYADVDYDEAVQVNTSEPKDEDVIR